MSKLIRSLEGIWVNEKRCKELAMSSRALITILAHLIGYEKAVRLAEELDKGRGIEDVLVEMGVNGERVRRILSKERLVSPGFPALDR
ncbi:MAG: hypothetical protein BA066_03140 [Candidatus Korarchaeota archaeon NZ13-K]|nr:MAG: hypothetical protein BA066_03140 [Candidatus Korarchaeota archaeon NZ13-K]